MHLGNTIVQCKVHSEIVEPKPERPTEGFLKFLVDLNQI